MQIDRRPARRRFRHPAARKARIEAALLDEADVEHASAKDLIGQSGSGEATKSVDKSPMAASAETPGILSRISDSLLSGKNP